jgi:hypothetical protein
MSHSRWQWQGERRYYTDPFSGFSLFVSRKNPEWQASLACATAIGMALKQAGFHSSGHHAKGLLKYALAHSNARAGGGKRIKDVDCRHLCLARYCPRAGSPQ